MIERLKSDNQSEFYGALYETYVAAHFIKAGFDLEFENEADRLNTHCEFTASCQKTANLFFYSGHSMVRGYNEFGKCIRNSE